MDYFRQALGLAVRNVLKEEAREILHDAKHPPFWRKADHVALVWEWPHDADPSFHIEAPTPEEADNMFRAARKSGIHAKVEAVRPRDLRGLTKDNPIGISLSEDRDW